MAMPSGALTLIKIALQMQSASRQALATASKLLVVPLLLVQRTEDSFCPLRLFGAERLADKRMFWSASLVLIVINRGGKSNVIGHKALRAYQKGHWSLALRVYQKGHGWG